MFRNWKSKGRQTHNTGASRAFPGTPLSRFEPTHSRPAPNPNGISTAEIIPDRPHDAVTPDYVQSPDPEPAISTYLNGDENDPPIPVSVLHHALARRIAQDTQDDTANEQASPEHS